MKSSDFAKLSSKELKGIVEEKKKELGVLEDILFEVKNREYKSKYITVRVEGCNGCQLENYRWNSTCDHCDGYYYKDIPKK